MLNKVKTATLQATNMLSRRLSGIHIAENGCGATLRLSLKRK